MTKSASLQAESFEQDVENAGVQPLEVTVERALLLKALGHVQSVVERRNALQILANVKIVAVDGSLSLTATDTDIEITEKIAVNVKREGSITVPAHTLYDIVRKLPDGAEIELKVDENAGNKMEINTDSCNFSLPCLPVDDFPTMDNDNVTHSFKLLPLEVIALIDKTKFAISTEETRYYLNGIFLHSKDGGEVGGGKICTVATDGHRLAKVEIDAPYGAENIAGVIIPRKTTVEIRKLVEEGVGEVQISLSDTKICVVSGNAVLTSKLVDGSFPDYEKVIPSDNDKEAIIDSVAIARCVDRVSTISADKTKAVRMIFSDNKLTVIASSDENGTAREDLEIEYSDDATEIAFNSRYVLDMMSVIQGDKIHVRLKDSKASVVIRDSNDPNSLFVLMSMQV